MKYEGLIFINRNFDFNKLQKFGFKLLNNEYTYKTTIMDDFFEIFIKINHKGEMDVKLYEIETGEDYNLIFVKNTEGEFVGKAREEFENVLVKIKEECTFFTAFKTEYANSVIKYIKEKYNDKAEYLWEKLPNACVFRRNDKKGKWYAIILTVAKNKIGLNGDEITEIIDLKAKPEIIEKLVDNKRYFHGYHMNKKHWFSICLDGSVDIKEIQDNIDVSYNML